MATLKAISIRLKSVKNIQKITKSMKMVSAAKYSRAERELRQARPYGEGAQVNSPLFSQNNLLLDINIQLDQLFKTSCLIRLLHRHFIHFNINFYSHMYVLVYLSTYYHFPCTMSLSFNSKCHTGQPTYISLELYLFYKASEMSLCPVPLSEVKILLRLMYLWSNVSLDLQ